MFLRNRGQKASLKLQVKTIIRFQLNISLRFPQRLSAAFTLNTKGNKQNIKLTSAEAGNLNLSEHRAEMTEDREMTAVGVRIISPTKQLEISFLTAKRTEVRKKRNIFVSLLNSKGEPHNFLL